MNENMTGRTAVCDTEGETRSSERTLCINAVLAFLTMALVAAVSLVLGAIFFIPVLSALAALIVLIVILSVLIIALLIFKHCMREDTRTCGCQRRR